MNNISEQLLQAMDILVDDKISKLEYDKTIEGRVTQIVNLDAGEYKVRYKGNIFSAFSNDLNSTYKTDDSVFVSVPEGNFSNKKFITGLVTAQSLSYALLMALQNSIFEISPTFESLYGGNLYDPVIPNERGEYERDGYGVIAGAPPQERDKGYTYIYEGPTNFEFNDGFHGLFQQYSNNYELIRIQASFMTQLQSAHIKGNYGLEVEFYAKNEQGGVTPVSYKLDLNHFNGDPYRYSIYSPQSVVIKALKNYLLGLKSIKLFLEEFEYDRIIRSGLVTDEYNTTVPNIFVRDIKILYVDVKDLTDTNYYLMIAAPKGIMLRENVVSSLDLVGRLIYQGKDIMDVRPSGNISDKEQESLKCKCEWFERDLSVMIGSDKYNKNAGFGWKPLDYNGSKLTVNANNIKHLNRYKLLVTYNKTTFVSAEIEVFNYDSGYKYHIEQKTDKDDIGLALINDIDEEELLQGDWYISYPDGAYQYLLMSNFISVSPYLNYSSVIFYCAVRGRNNLVIGTLEHTIVNTESSEDLIVEYIGEDSFRYDANGDITIEDSERERTLLTRLTWNNNIGTKYTVNWIVKRADGTELVLDGHPERLPDSMIDNLWVDNYNILHYTIKLKYRIDFLNNSVFVKVKLLTGETYLFQKEILFLKDGDLGTNGTTYVIAIRPCDEDGDKLSGFNPLRYINGRWQGSQDLRCYVYRDGELISKKPFPVSGYTINYKWTAYNVDLSSDDSDQVTARGMGIIDYNNSSTCLFYVKVLVSINDHTNNRLTEIYSSYPLDVVDGSINKDDVDISGIPSYIKYTSSGLTPQFYRDPIECKYKGNKINKDNIISLNTNVLEFEENTKLGVKYLKPAASFIYENIKENNESNIGVLRCLIGNGLYIIHPIIMYLDVYGNEAINGWDGTYLDMGIPDENGKYHYLFAPLVGAGEKDSLNRFSGVVMGKDSSLDMIGLYGYKAGLNTFGLLSNGRAYFGAKAGGGLIVLDGRYATLFGGDVELNESNGRITPAANGMYIRLADKDDQVSSTTKAIGIGWSTHKDEHGRDQTEENFFVTYDGELRATEANIHGKIYAYEGLIGGTARLGGWTIKKNRLYSGSSSSYVELNSAPVPSEGDSLINPSDLSERNFAAIWAGKSIPGETYTKTRQLNSSGDMEYGDITYPADFVITKDGFLYAKNAKIAGYIESKGGKIGGWTINRRSITSSGDGNLIQVGMASSGSAAFWVGENLDEDSNNIPKDLSLTRFLVTRRGKLYCSSADISGGVRATSLYIGSGTNNVVSGDGLTGEALNNGAVSSVKISNGAITVDKIKDGAVSTTKIRGGAITTEKISALAITTEKISTKAITADKILIGAVTTEKIQAEAVTSNKIAAGAITSGKIAANAITANNIAAGSITSDKIAAGSISADKITTGDAWGLLFSSDGKISNNVNAGAYILVSDYMVLSSIGSIELNSEDIILNGNISGSAITDSIGTYLDNGGYINLNSYAYKEIIRRLDALESK